MRFLKNLRIGTKLVLALVIMFALTVLVGITEYIGTRSVHRNLEAFIDVRVPALELLSGIDRDLQAVLTDERALLAAEPESAISGQLQGNIRTLTASAEERMKKLKALEMPSGERSGLPELEAAWGEWKQVSTDLAARLSEGTAEGRSAAAALALAAEPEKAGRVQAVVGKMKEAQFRGFGDIRADIESDNRNTMIAVILLMALSALIATGMSLALVHGVVRPLHSVIEGLTMSSEQLYSASSQISQASQEMAEGANEQASSIQEISSSLEEMTAMTRQNAENARLSSTMVREAQRVAENGAQSMHRMNEAIDRIKESSEETAKIMKTIDEIAFQTNLLALNAAVEAARAGEAGAGFAVVADEVRNLAQRVAEAARVTSALIEESKTNAQHGVAASREVGDILTEIDQAASKMTRLISEVSAASDEQAQGIALLNDSIAHMDRMTQNTASSAEESASAGLELATQAEDLGLMVREIIAIVGGSAEDPEEYEPEEYEDEEESPVASPASVPRKTAAVETARVSAERSVSEETPAFSRVIRPEEVIPFDRDEFEEF